MSFTLTLIAQAVAFALFIWFTIKFVWPPLLRAIEARQKTIADGLAAAEQGRKSLEVATQQADDEIRKAPERAAAICSQPDKRVSQMIAEAKTSAKAHV